MAIKYNSTTLSSIVYNGTTIRAISYGGTTYCVGCAYSSSSCGSPCSGSSSSASCGTCTTSNSSTCNVACTSSTRSCVCGIALGPLQGVSPLATYALCAEKAPIGEFPLEEQRAKWFAWIMEQDTEWGSTYHTYVDNPDVPQEHKDDFERIYNEVHTSLTEETKLLETQLKEQFPNMQSYDIAAEEGKVYVY